MNHIFTHIGAEDEICYGESVCHRELTKTLETIYDASENALVMIDELAIVVYR